VYLASLKEVPRRVRHRGSEPAVQIIRSLIVGVPNLIVIVSLDDDFYAEGFIPSAARVSVPEIGAFQAINPKSGLNALG